LKSSQEIKDIAAAISKLQAENRGAEDEAVNPFFKSKYSTLKDIWDSIRESVGKYGLCILQDATTKDTCVSVTTIICHSSGQWIEFGPFDIPFGKKDAHSIGSSTSYAKRYALCAALGIVSGTDDDDGNQTMPKKDLVSQDQLEKIIETIGNDDEYRNSILSFYRINSLAEIKASKFNAVIKSANKRAENRKPKEEQNGL
jgi:hypothetical protein